MKKPLSTLKLAALTLGILFSTLSNAQFTAVQSGDWSNSATWGGTAPSSTVTGQNITIPTGINVNLNADVTFNGLINTFVVNGMLSSTSSNWVHITSGSFAGTGTVSINKLWLSGLSTIAFTGSLTLKTMVNSVSSLAFTSMVNITDTLELESGSLDLNTNAYLTMVAGSTIKVRNGALAVNTGTFNSSNAYNIMYVGTSKTAGAELNGSSMQNLTIKLDNNNETITLANGTMINGNLDMSSGKLKLNGKKLTLKGDLMMASGAAFDSDNASQLEIQGSGNLTGTLMFSSGNSISAITIHRTPNGQVKLGSAVMIAVGGQLNLMDGNMSVESGGTLTLGNNSTVHVEKGSLSLNSGTFNGTSVYNVEYSGSADATTGVELSGSGLNNVKVNYISGSNKLTLNGNTTLNGKLDMMNGKLDLNGKNLMLSGTFQQSTTSWFIGNASSELHLNLTSVNSGDMLYFDATSASNQTLGKLRINTSGSNYIKLGSKLIINNELSFVMGKIELGNGDLEIMPAASITGYDDTKYIITSESSNGVLIQNVTAGSAYVTFPIGLSSNYSPAYVQQTSAGATGNFSAKCHSLVTTGSGTLKAVNRAWLVEGAGVTNVNANLKFGWQTSSEVNGFDRTNAYVSHFTNSMWDVSASSSASVGVYNTYELSRTGLTSLSPFAVVENGQPLKVNELSKISSIEIYPNPSKDVINIKVINPSDEYQYELIDITGRTILSTSNANPVNKFDVSGLGAGCYFVKITNLSDNKSTTKRLIKQ